MLIRLFVCCCLWICVLCDDLIPIPELPKISIPKVSIGGNGEDSSSKKLKIAGQKHVLGGAGAAGIEKKEGNAEKSSNYEKDRGFFFMKAYGWDREKKAEHANAEGKHLKAGKFGKIFKAGGEFSKKLSENQGSADQHDAHKYDQQPHHDTSLYDQGEFGKRMGYTRPSGHPMSMKIFHKEYKQPEVEYTVTEGPASYKVIEPKPNYYPNKEYTRIHYPTTETAYVPEMSYKNTYDTYSDREKYPMKKLWNQGYHANKYFSRPITDDNHIENNLIQYYGDEKTKYRPLHITHDSHKSTYKSMNEDHYSGEVDRYPDDRIDDEENEGRYYYDPKMRDHDIDKLRASYSKYNDDYAGSQLQPHKVQIPASSSTNQGQSKKPYRLWLGSHYY